MASHPPEPDVCESCQCLRPATPPPESCCGDGCSVCVYDIHDQEVALWKKTCRKKHLAPEEEDENDPSQAVMSPLDYEDYKIESITPVCLNTAIYRFTLPVGRRLDLDIAKHIILRGKYDGRVITRQYTPITAPHATGYFDVLIKLYDDGEMSGCIRHWQVGDRVEWRGPFGAFTHQPNKEQRLIMVAAGTGITPIIQVLRHILEDEMDETIIRLLYSCNTYSQLLLRDELNQLALFWNLTITYFLTKDAPGSHPAEYGENIEHGRITEETVTKEVESAASQSFRALVCGTRAFEDDMIGFLKEAGVAHNQINKF